MAIYSEQQFEPIKKVNLSQKLVDYFIQKIEDGSFPIGERVPDEINLAKQLNVSRNILRESMKILENYGILHTVNGKGTMVSGPALANIQSMRFFEKLRNDTTVLQLLEARKILEPQIAFYACKCCTEKDIAHLQEIVAMPFHIPDAGGRTDDYDFHIAIAKICGNDMLTEFLYTMICHLREGAYSQFNFHVETILRENSQREHKDIVDAFLRHDPKMASRTMEIHITNRINIIRSLYHPNMDPSELNMDTVIDAMYPDDASGT